MLKNFPGKSPFSKLFVEVFLNISVFDGLIRVRKKSLIVFFQVGVAG
jgi:hypothetical protein